MSVSVDSPRYSLEYVIEANSVDLKSATAQHPNWYTVVAEFSNSAGERGWSTLNTVSADTGSMATFVTSDKEIAETVALRMVADNELPAYVRSLREAAIGLPAGDSPYWDYEKQDWKRHPVIF